MSTFIWVDAIQFSNPSAMWMDSKYYEDALCKKIKNSVINVDCLIILIWWEPVGLAVFSDYSWPAFSPSTDSCKLSNCSINYHSSCSSQQTGNHLCSFLADVFIQSQGSCLLSFKRLAKQCLFPGGPPLNSLLILKRVYASKSLRWSLSCLSPSRL